jgi:hypothetical protein
MRWSNQRWSNQRRFIWRQGPLGALPSALEAVRKSRAVSRKGEDPLRFAPLPLTPL